MTYLNATSRESFSLRKSLLGLFLQKHFVTAAACALRAASPRPIAAVFSRLSAIKAVKRTTCFTLQDHYGLHRYSRLRLARKRAHPPSTSQLGLDSPLLRIGDPSPYATVFGGSLVDPTVLQVLRSYPLSFYQPKHDPGPLVASDTSLAGAQTTPPETSLSSPKRKKLQKPPICRTFTNIPSA